MENNAAFSHKLPNAVKAALQESGVIAELKQAVYVDKTVSVDTEALKGKAEAMADDLQQLVNSGTLDEADLQKLSGVLMRLRGALEGGTVSREALAVALSEASGAIASASTLKAQAAKEKAEQLWQQVEQHNQAINDDFKKMQQAGIVFDDELWEKHQRLSDHMQEHPRDIEKQKELNAVDDKLLEQAESQLAKHPEARPAFEHAKKESEARHNAVDKDLSQIKKSISKTDFDWGNDLSIDDIQTPTVGQKVAAKGAAIS